MILVGIIGVIILLLAWLIETFENIRKKKIAMHKHFAILYVIGIAALTYYAYKIRDPVFFWLNIALLIAVLAELAYSITKPKFKYVKK